jgi:hypothetical protein
MLGRVVEGLVVLEALVVIREILGKTFLGSGSSFLKIPTDLRGKSPSQVKS